MSGGRRGSCNPSRTALANFPHKHFRRYKERILIEDASDDDHRMSPHDVDHRVSSELRKMIGADDRVIMLLPHMIHARFELDEVVDVRSIFDRPVHPAADSTERITALGVTAG